eukprot:11167035-Lingulodinium_polyedra.AAC.1
MAAALCCGELALAYGMRAILARDPAASRGGPAAGRALLRRFRGAPYLPAPGELGCQPGPFGMVARRKRGRAW